MKNIFCVVSFVLFSLFSICVRSQTTTADPAYANMQRAVAGITQQVATSRGTSTTDPRTYATLYGMGRAAATSTAIGAVGTGLLVTAGAVTAPAWGTILAVSAISGAVSYAVSLGLDKLVNWYFSPTGVSSALKDTQTIICSSASGQNGADCRTCPAGYTFVSSNPYLPGSVSTFTLICQKLSTTAVAPMAQAASALTTSQLAQPVDYSAMASIINYLWLKASQQPDYQGLPYVATQPVTTAEVQQWAVANPTIYPNVQALVSPVASPTGFAPSSTTSTASSLAPVTAQVNPYATPQTQSATTTTVQIDLGSNPNIGPPTLEPTPTAQSIFQPFLDLVQPILHFSFNAPSGTCPRPAFDVFGKSVTMTSHCDIAENNRPALGLIMAAVYTIIALFIIFKA
jgi:hypothetical protein